MLTPVALSGSAEPESILEQDLRRSALALIIEGLKIPETSLKRIPHGPVVPLHTKLILTVSRM